MTIEFPTEFAIAAIAAVVGLIVASWATRGHDDSRPAPAVRVYSALFRSTGIGKLRSSVEARARHPRREAFLATWFLTFFAIFIFGVFVWPSIPGR